MCHTLNKFIREQGIEAPHLAWRRPSCSHNDRFILFRELSLVRRSGVSKPCYTQFKIFWLYGIKKLVERCEKMISHGDYIIKFFPEFG